MVSSRQGRFTAWRAVARALAPLCAVAVALLPSACRRDVTAAQDDNPAASADTTLTVSSELRVLSLPTYEGSGQAVHPDFLTPVRPWSRRARYLTATPFPFGETRHENPSLWSGLDGVRWSVARGTPNPLVFPAIGYLSDPDIVYASRRNELFLYYRQVSDSDRVNLIRSADGVTWDPPVELFAGELSRVLSPAVVRRAADHWLMWSVNADSGCRGPRAQLELRRSLDGFAWGPPTPVSLDARGYSPWHVDVQWIAARNEYWALFPVKTYGTCATRAVFLATSPDGEAWSMLPAAVLRAGAIPAFRDVVYRATFAYDEGADAITFWFSGARLVGEEFLWSVAVQRRSRAEVFDARPASRVSRPDERRRVVNALFTPP